MEKGWGPLTAGEDHTVNKSKEKHDYFQTSKKISSKAFSNFNSSK
jgi:hypothetical protein